MNHERPLTPKNMVAALTLVNSTWSHARLCGTSPATSSSLHSCPFCSHLAPQSLKGPPHTHTHNESSSSAAVLLVDILDKMAPPQLTLTDPTRP